MYSQAALDYIFSLWETTVIIDLSGSYAIIFLSLLFYKINYTIWKYE